MKIHSLRSWILSIALLSFLTVVIALSGCKYISHSAASYTGSTYYIAPDGKKNADGSKANPFGSFDDAIYVLEAGDTLIVLPGTYYPTESIALPKELGDMGDYEITIDGEDNAIIDGSKLVQNGDSMDPLMTIAAQNITISGLSFTNASGDYSCAIELLAGAQEILIKDNEISNIKVADPSNTDGIGANAILLYGDDEDNPISNVTIIGNYIHDCQTGWNEAVSVEANCTDIKIQDNAIADTGNIGIDLSGNYGYCKDPSVDFPRDCDISGNEVSDCVSPNETSYGIYVDGAQDVYIGSNTVFSCGGGIEIGAEQPQKSDAYATSDITVKDNTITNNIACSIAVGGYEKNLGNVKNVLLTGNTCLQEDATDSVLSIGKCEDITFTGNTFAHYGENADNPMIDNTMTKTETHTITFDSNTFTTDGEPLYIWHGTGYNDLSKFYAAVKKS